MSLILPLMWSMDCLVVKVLKKIISLICFRVYLEVIVFKNPTCFSRWSVSPTLLVFRDPTYTNIGTARIPRFLGSGTNTASRVGGESSTEQHVLLEPNTDYFVVARNVSGAAQSRIGLYIEWFEVDYYDFG